MKSMDATYCSITDAVQALGKIPVAVKGVDMISVSGHKIHGPKERGLSSIRKGLSIPAFMVGGRTGAQYAFRNGEYGGHSRLRQGCGYLSGEFFRMGYLP